MELERLPVDLAHVFGEQHAFNVALQSTQLVIVFALVIWDYRDSVVQLVGVRVSSVVNQENLGQISIHHPQIFDVDALRSEHTIFPEKSMMDVLVVGVQIVQNYVGIARVACCENYYLEVSCQHL